MQRPVAMGLQAQLADGEAQIRALQVHSGQLQPLAIQAGGQHQLAQLLDAIDLQAAQLQATDIKPQRQADVRQAQRFADRLLGRWRQIDLQTGGGEFIQAQQALAQTTETVGHPERLQRHARLAGLPAQRSGAPVAKQSTAEVLHRQSRHAAEQPAAAGFGRRQAEGGRQHQQQEQPGNTEPAQ
ncbi:hypothetical protein D3C80_646980 [compost metagenome]